MGRPRKADCRHSNPACAPCVSARASAKRSYLLRGILKVPPREYPDLSPYARAHYLADGGGW